MKIREIMTSNPACCTADTSLREVARLMVENDCGEIPVVDSQESQKPIGVVTDRDIVVRAVAQGRNPLDLVARDVMSSPAMTVTPDVDLDQCATMMEEHQIRRVPVVDDAGRVAGIVAQADIVRTARDRMAADLVREVSEAPQAPHKR